MTERGVERERESWTYENRSDRKLGERFGDLDPSKRGSEEDGSWMNEGEKDGNGERKRKGDEVSSSHSRSSRQIYRKKTHILEHT